MTDVRMSFDELREIRRRAEAWLPNIGNGISQQAIEDRSALLRELDAVTAELNEARIRGAAK